MADLVDIVGWLDLQGIDPSASQYIKGEDFADWDWDKAIAGGYSDDEVNDTMRRAWRVFRNENPDFPQTTNPIPSFQSRRYGDWKASHLERRGRRPDASWGDVQIGLRTCTVRAGLDIDSVSNKILNALNSWARLERAGTLELGDRLFQNRENLANRFRMISNAVKSIIEDDISPNLGDDTTFYYALEHFQRLVQRQARAYTILARAERLDGLALDDDDFIPELWDLVKQAERLRIDNVESTYPRWSSGGSWIGDELLNLYPNYEGSYGEGIVDTVIDRISDLHNVQSNLVQNHVRNAVWRYLDQVLDIEITRNRTFEGNKLTSWLDEGLQFGIGQVYWWRIPRVAAKQERVEAAIRDMFGDLSGYRQSRILEYTGAKTWFDAAVYEARSNFRFALSAENSPASFGGRFSWVQRNVELIQAEIPGPTSTGAWVLNDRVSLYEIWEERGPGFNLVALETLIDAMRRFRWWTDSLEDRLRLRFDEGIEELRQFAGGATISQRSDTLADVLARSVLYEDRPTLLTAEELARASDLEIDRAAQAVLLERGEPEYLTWYMTREQRIELITLRPAEFDARTVVRPATEFSPEIEGTPLEVAKFAAAEHAGRSATEAAEVQMRWQPPFLLELLDSDLDTRLVGHGPVTSETAVLIEEAMPTIDDLFDALVDERSVWYWTEEGRLVNRIPSGTRTKIVFDPNVGPDHLPKVIEEPTVLSMHFSGGRILSPVMIRWMDAIWTELPNMAEWQARRVLRWLDDPGADDAFRSMLAGFTYGDPGVRGRLFGGGLPIGTKPNSMSRFVGEPDVFFPPVPRSGLAEEALDLGDYPFTGEEIDIDLQRFIQQRIDAGYLTEDIRRLAVTLSRELAENASTPFTDALRRRRVELMDALLETPPHIDFAGIRWTNPASDGAVLRIWRQASTYGLVDDLPADPSWDRQVWEMVRERIENGTMSAGLADMVEDWLGGYATLRSAAGIRTVDLWRMQVMEALTSRKVIPADKPESIFYGSTQDVVRTWLEPASDHLLATVRRGLPDVGDVDRRIPPFVLNAGDRVLVDELVRRIESGNLTSGQASAAIRWKTAKLTGNEDVIADATDLLAESLSKGRPRPMAEALAQRTEVEQGTSAIAPWTGIIEPGPSADRLRPPVPKLDGVPQWRVPETWVEHPNPPSLSGISSKIFYQDANGDTWMIKGGGSNQPGEAEFATHTLSYMVGVDQPPTVLLRVPEDFAAPGGFTDTRTVVAFRLWTAEGGSLDSLSYSIYGQADQNASPAQLAQLLENFAIDSFIGNTDTHSANFLLVRSGPAAGRILGIDKGFAFGTDSIFQRGARSVPIGPVYSNIFESYRRGEIDLDWDVLGRIVERIGDVTDEQIRIIWRPFVEQAVARGRYIDAGTLSQPRARTVQAQLQAIVDRKNNFRDDVEAFVQERIVARRGARQDLVTPDWVPQWKRREVISPIDEVFVEEIRTVGTAGKAVIVNSPEIHSGVIKFDIVTNQLGEEIVRAHVQFRDSTALTAFQIRLLTDRKFRTDNFEFVLEPKLFYQSSRVSMDPVPGKTNELLIVRAPYDNPDYSRPRHGNANTPEHGDFETGVIGRTVDGVEINGVFATGGIAETFKGQFELLVSPSGRFTSKILTQSEILDWKPVAEMDAWLVAIARDEYGRVLFLEEVFDRGEIDIVEAAGRVNMRFIRDASIPGPVPGTVSEEDFDYWMTAWQGYGREVAARIAHGLGWRSIPEGFIMSPIRSQIPRTAGSQIPGGLTGFLWRNFFNYLATDGFEDWRFISPSTGLRDARATVFAQRDYRAEFGEGQVSRFEDLFDDISQWKFVDGISREQRREINRQVVQHQILSWFLGARKQGNYEDWLYVRDPVSGQNFMVDQDFQPFFRGFGLDARTNPGDIDRMTIGDREGNAFAYLWEAFAIRGTPGFPVLIDRDFREIREYILDIQNLYRKGEEWQDTLRGYGLLMEQVQLPDASRSSLFPDSLGDAVRELSDEVLVTVEGAGSLERGLEDRIDLAYSRMADFLADQLAEQQQLAGSSVINEAVLGQIFVTQFDPDQVTVAHLQRILDTIENRLGFNIELLTQDAQDELYWELNLGQEIVNTGGASEVVRRAQDGLAQLTTSEPGPRIEVIRNAFVDGKVLAQFEEVDTTPYYPHLITGEEFGKPIFARPNPVFLDEQGVPILYDIALVHRLAYLARNADFWWLGRHGGAGSEVLSSQLDRIEWGTFIEPRFQDAAYHDRYVGGASSVYAQIFSVNPDSPHVWPQHDLSEGGMIFMNPARQYLKYNTYTSNSDTDGATALRPQGHGRTPLDWKEKNLGTYGRETMIRGSVTLFDDIEILISDEDEVRRLIQWAHDQGVTHIRGVPVAARWIAVDVSSGRVIDVLADEVSSITPQEYVRDFFRKYVDYNPRSLQWEIE